MIGEVRGAAFIHDRRPVGADARIQAVTIGLRAIGAHAETPHAVCLAFPKEHIPHTVRVAADQVVSLGLKHDIETVSADRRPTRLTIRFRAGRERDALGLAQRVVAHEHIRLRRGVPRIQVVRGAVEDDVATIGRDVTATRRRVALHLDRVHARAFAKDREWTRRLRCAWCGERKTSTEELCGLQ